MIRISMKKKTGLGYFDTRAVFDDWKKIGRFSKLDVYVDGVPDESLWVEVVDSSYTHPNSPKRVKRVLEIQLSLSVGGAYHVDMTRLDWRYSGKGLAAKAYRYIIKKLGITLQAGKSQSKGGRKVWYDLAQRQDILVSAKTKYGKPIQVGIDTEKREVWCENKEIYDGGREMFVFATAA